MTRTLHRPARPGSICSMSGHLWLLGTACVLISACSSSRPLPEADGGVAFNDDSTQPNAPNPAPDDTSPSTDEAGAGDDVGRQDASVVDSGKDARVVAKSVDAGPDAQTSSPSHLREAGQSAGEASAPPASLLDSPLAPFPERFSAVGLYQVSGDFEKTHQRALNYVPRHPLWSNGGDKQRYLVLPPGSQIDISERQRWQFPIGTLLLKSFFFHTEVGEAARAVETRVLRRGNEGWDYVVYLWDDDQDEAWLSDMSLPIAVEVLGPDNAPFDHLVPSGRQCARCHDAGLSNVLGFSELQLNDWDIAQGATQLEVAADASLFTQALPEPSLRVEFDDPLTHEVIGYMQGNCVHCHNGRDSELNAFDMRVETAVGNLIDQPTQSNASASGIRIVPGEPAQSIVFLALSGETDNPEVQQMPNVGVQLRDAETIEVFRSWILSLE